MNSLAERNRTLATYRQVQKETLSGRNLEAAVLGKAAHRLRQSWEQYRASGDDQSLVESLRFNLRVWDVFHSDWEGEECTLPAELRTNLLRLSIYVHRTVLECLAEPAENKLTSLLRINDCLAAGLQGRAPVQLAQV